MDRNGFDVRETSSKVVQVEVVVEDKSGPACGRERRKKGEGEGRRERKRLGWRQLILVVSFPALGDQRCNHHKSLVLVFPFRVFISSVAGFSKWG